uniref:Down syndrome cell adhesion moleculelike protein CG42256like [Acyrthosiphon pisum] n=2 Tax=Lepeophtheirus salmonis TaxID=72036 RepID=A0A0K2U4B9_LEPSM
MFLILSCLTAAL